MCIILFILLIHLYDGDATLRIQMAYRKRQHIYYEKPIRKMKSLNVMLSWKAKVNKQLSLSERFRLPNAAFQYKIAENCGRNARVFIRCQIIYDA